MRTSHDCLSHVVPGWMQSRAPPGSGWIGPTAAEHAHASSAPRCEKQPTHPSVPTPPRAGRPGHMSPIGDPGPSPRSDCVAAMDMLNDMFQRQARRLETQLYQRAQDARMIESAHRQAQETMHQVRSLERYHVDQAARIRQGTKAIEELQQQMRAASKEHELVLSTCEALSDDVDKLKSSLLASDPAELEALELATDSTSLPTVAALRERASSLEASVCEAERTASMHIAATPSTTVTPRPTLPPTRRCAPRSLPPPPPLPPPPLGRC